MTTRGALITRILDDLERPSATWNTRVTEAINDAIEQWQSTRFHFNESRSVTFSTADGTDFYAFDGASPAIGTDFYKIDVVKVTESNQDYTLTPRDYADIIRVSDASSTKNRPYEYGFIDQGLLLYPKPDATYTITLTGHVKLAAPANDSEANNSWMVDAFELIRCSAKLYLAVHVLHDTALAQAMVAAENRALKQLMGVTTAKTSTGRLVPTQF